MTGRGSAWTDSPKQGGLSRAFGSVGVRGTTYLSRVYPEWCSEAWDINGVRHIIKPKITAWTSESNLDKEDLFPFDETVEEISATDGVTIGVRQRFQPAANRIRILLEFLGRGIEIAVHEPQIISPRLRTGT